jgi:hypothetical protein
MGWCSNDTAYEMTGKTKHPSSLATSVAIRSEIRESVDIGRCAPCCSREPTGTMALFIFLISLVNLV